jgi:PAS domain S-box-containing protein
MNDAAGTASSHDHRLRAEREAQRIFEMSPALLAVAGFDGYLRRFNPAFAVFGYSRDELLSRPWIEFAHPDDRDRMAQAAASLERGVDVVEVHNRVVCRDGSLRWVEWSTRIVPGEQLFYAAGRDVTESRRAAVANAEAWAEVARLADEQTALRRIATLVAHGAQPNAVFDAVTREVADVLEGSGVSLARYDDDGLAVVAHSGTTYVRTGERYPLGGTNVTSTVLRTGRIARLDDYTAASGRIGEFARRAGVRSAVGAPVVVEGRTWGVLVAIWADREAPPHDTDHRMASFAELVGTAIANADSRDQLTASRARLLAAGDDARRRVVRDLHDGAQQRLVHTILKLKHAQQVLHRDLSDAETLLAEALGSAEEATAEMRELAHGIMPSVLTRGGLRAAVDAFVSRVDLPVDVDISSERFPTDIEPTAYFIVAEALTNVLKHARATRATVRAAVDDDVLTLEVHDDGVGRADPEGHGLMGIADRVEALGGQLRIDSADGEGTVLIARLPSSTR